MALIKQRPSPPPDPGDCPKCGAPFNAPVRTESHRWFADYVTEHYRCQVCGTEYEAQREKTADELANDEPPPSLLSRVKRQLFGG